MYTSSSNRSSQFGKFSFMQEFARVERTSGKRPSQTYIFFLSLLLQNCTIHDVDNVKSSHLIKLVHAVQSLKKKKKCTHVTP